MPLAQGKGCRGDSGLKRCFFSFINILCPAIVADMPFCGFTEDLVSGYSHFSSLRFVQNPPQHPEVPWRTAFWRLVQRWRCFAAKRYTYQRDKNITAAALAIPSA